MPTGCITVRGRLLSFLDLLAITVAVMVMVLAIVPDQPFGAEPTDWYSFTLEIDPRAVTAPDGTDATSNLELGFLLLIEGEPYDLSRRGDGSRSFTCDPSGLELTCFFRGDPGERVEGYFFLRDDRFLLEDRSVVTGSVLGMRIGLEETAIALQPSNWFNHSYSGSLE